MTMVTVVKPHRYEASLRAGNVGARMCVWGGSGASQWGKCVCVGGGGMKGVRGVGGSGGAAADTGILIYPRDGLAPSTCPAWPLLSPHLAKLCLPLPPTPTSRAWPPGLLMMRAILQGAGCRVTTSTSTTPRHTGRAAPRGVDCTSKDMQTLRHTLPAFTLCPSRV